MVNVGCAGGGGARTRAIGTGDEVTAVRNTDDSIGYSFYSIEALPFQSAAASPVTFAYKYLTLNSSDPLAPAGTSNGFFFTCGTPQKYFCQAATAT